MSYEKQQQQWVEKHGVEVGDTLRVDAILLNPTDGQVLYDWPNTFVPEMRELKGQAGEVLEITHAGIHLEFEGGGTWSFPFFCLQPVGDPRFQAAIAAFKAQHLNEE